MEQQLKRMRLAVWLLFAFVFAATVALLLCWFLIVPANDAENIRNFKMYLVAVLALAGYVAIQTLLGASYFITKLPKPSETMSRKPTPSARSE
jgi:heme A synthase